MPSQKEIRHLQAIIEERQVNGRIVYLIHHPKERITTAPNDSPWNTFPDEWQVRIDMGGVIHEFFHQNEDMAKYYFNSITDDIIARVVDIEVTRSVANDKRLKLMEELRREAFRNA